LIAFPQFCHQEIPLDCRLAALIEGRRGSAIHRVPRRCPARARVVETARFQGCEPRRIHEDVEHLGAYPDATLLRANGELGQSTVVREACNRAWRATAGRRARTPRRDAAGFRPIDAPPSGREIRLEFTIPLEHRACCMAMPATLPALLSVAQFRRREPPL
jgi:hypothetical protein